MGRFGSGRDEGDLSWTNEVLPLEVRRALLDKALEDFRAAKAARTAGKARAQVAAVPDRAGQSGAGRNIATGKDKPKA
jgi:hypothetical protein